MSKTMTIQQDPNALTPDPGGDKKDYEFDRPVFNDIDLLTHALAGGRGEDQQAIASEVVRLGVLLLRKNADYGSSVWQSPVLAPDCSPGVAIRVRMSDKLSRLTALLQATERCVANETIDDTLRDFVGYGVLELARPGRNSE